MRCIRCRELLSRGQGATAEKQMSGIDFKQKSAFNGLSANRSRPRKSTTSCGSSRAIAGASLTRPPFAVCSKNPGVSAGRNAAVRSRLTHSMEVQQVGRHIAKEILNRFKQAGRIDELGLTRLLDPFESIVEMACLMHDIGNPPFGHFGESAINDWFAQRLDPASCGSEPGSHDRCLVATLRLHEGRAI